MENVNKLKQLGFFKKVNKNDLATANIALAVHGKDIYVAKNRMGCEEGWMSKHKLRRLLKKSTALGFGSASWLVVKI